MGMDISLLGHVVNSLSQRRHIQEDGDKMVKLLYIKILKTCREKWLYSNVVVHDQGEGGILQR